MIPRTNLIPQPKRLPAVSSVEDLRGLTVADIMTVDPVTVTEETRLSEVLELMKTHRILHFPVLRGDQLVGLISERCLRDAQPSVLMLESAEARQRTLARARASDVAIREPRAISASASLLTAIVRMRTLRAGSLPVTEQGKLVGILTAGDLIALLATVLEDRS